MPPDNNTIYLNGITTTGRCPECGDDCTTKHGSDSRGGKMHYTSCPTCGDQMLIVAWDCPHCPPTGGSDGR